MNSKTITAITTVTCVVVLIAWDVIAVTNDVKGDTISAIVWEVSQAWWSIAFGCGAVATHLFIPRRTSVLGYSNLTMLPVAALILVLANGLTSWIWGGAPWAPGVGFVLGAAAGHLLWPNEGEDGE